MESVLSQAAQQPAQRLRSLKLARHSWRRPRPPTVERGPATAADMGLNSWTKAREESGGGVPAGVGVGPSQLSKTQPLGLPPRSYQSIKFQTAHFASADFLHHSRGLSKKKLLNGDYFRWSSILCGWQFNFRMAVSHCKLCQSIN